MSGATASRSIIVTACDDTYAPLARDFLRSVRRLNSKTRFDIGVFDLGLSPTIRATLTPFDVIFKTPNIDIDYPGREAWEQRAPYYRAMTSRPYLRDYFPGYDAYMWMDADSWVQTSEAIETMLGSALENDALHIVSEIDRDYAPYFQGSQPWDYHLKWFKANFPDVTVARVYPRPMLNTGVMALSARAPIWEKWAEVFTGCLQSFAQLDRQNFMSEQLSLNVAQYVYNTPLKVMPCEFNWLTLYGLPMVDAASGDYVRPTVPRTKLSVIHLTHQKKLKDLDLQTTDGGSVKRQMTFGAYEQARG